VISDAHEGLKAAIAQVFKAPWQRCRVHFMRNCLAHVAKGQHSMVAAAIRTVFAQEDAAAGATAWRHVTDQLRSRFPKLAALMDDAETDVLAFMSFPRAHRPKLHSTNPLERLNKEVNRRANVVGIFPNEASVTRLARRRPAREPARRSAAPLRHRRAACNPRAGELEWTNDTRARYLPPLCGAWECRCECCA
jgi:putative transposase